MQMYQAKLKVNREEHDIIWPMSSNRHEFLLSATRIVVTSFRKECSMLPRVLVIDDFQTTLDLYHDLLESDKYELELSNYEFEDPIMIERLKPALIILDLQVDSQNRTRGWQLLDKLKMSRNISSIPIIICTPSMVDIREQENYLQDQGLMIFYKPFNLDKLVQKVQQILDISSSETK
jgi:CheY-like chemotaxis protein